VPHVSVVILTMGDRPSELRRAIDSVRRQQNVEAEVVLVVNGGNPDQSLVDKVVHPGENLGIPGGRNGGAAVSSSPVIMFLDDDGELVGTEVLSQLVRAFATRDQLAVVGLHIVDHEGDASRRYHPSLRPRFDRSGRVTSFPGGACAIRRLAFDEMDGLNDRFFYGLEETDLAWRLIDQGWEVIYRADLRMLHPKTTPDRHSDFFRGTARNRVWLAHRCLPLPLALLYVANWAGITALRNWRRPSAIRDHLRGTVEGVRDRPGQRRPMRWSTVVALSRLGRPPII
jgi:GT2 family glycosyltransferase